MEVRGAGVRSLSIGRSFGSEARGDASFMCSLVQAGPDATLSIFHLNVWRQRWLTNRTFSGNDIFALIFHFRAAATAVTSENGGFGECRMVRWKAEDDGTKEEGRTERRAERAGERCKAEKASGAPSSY